MNTITLNPDNLKIRLNGKQLTIAITNDLALELLKRWKLPMGAFMKWEDLSEEDSAYILNEIGSFNENLRKAGAE